MKTQSFFAFHSYCPVGGLGIHGTWQTLGSAHGSCPAQTVKSRLAWDMFPSSNRSVGDCGPVPHGSGPRLLLFFHLESSTLMHQRPGMFVGPKDASSQWC